MSLGKTKIELWIRLKIINIAWWSVPKRWCWASLVAWATISWKHYAWERKHKCGWCCACMTKEEMGEDVKAKFPNLPKIQQFPEGLKI